MNEFNAIYLGFALNFEIFYIVHFYEKLSSENVVY